MRVEIRTSWREGRRICRQRLTVTRGLLLVNAEREVVGKMDEKLMQQLERSRAGLDVAADALAVSPRSMRSAISRWFEATWAVAAARLW